MPRQIKFDDCIPFEKVVFSGKIFMYTTPGWDILFPVVDIIRLLKENTIISFKYGKGQSIIKNYGRQYKHNVTGCDLKTKKDYLCLKMVRCIFVFSDSQDTIGTNLINSAKLFEIPIICYSNVDGLYYLYENDTVVIYKKADEVIERMYLSFDERDIKKFDELFPELKIYDESDTVVVQENVLGSCLEKIKETTQHVKEAKVNTKIYDPHLYKLKSLEYQKAQKNIKYDDDIEQINKNLTKNRLLQFFKKK